MRFIIRLLLLLFLSVGFALAESPTEVVKSIFDQWYAIRPCYAEVESAFFEKNKDHFDPSLYADLMKSYSYHDQTWPGGDLLLGGQVPCYGYVVEQAKVNGDSAQVDVFCRLGLDLKRSRVYGQKVLLKRIKGQWRITDLDRGNWKLHKGVRAYLDYQAKSKK